MVKCNLAVLLAIKKMRLSELSRITGIRYMTLSDLYNEMALSIKFEHIDAICGALGCKSGDLIEFVPDKNSL